MYTPRHVAERPVIDMRHIHRIFESEAGLAHILHDISFSVQQGEFVAVVGPSGSDKSTLMNILGCLDTPTSGTYLLEGLDVAQPTDDELAEVRATRIGFVFQSFNLLPRMSVLDNVMLPLAYIDVPRREREVRAVHALRAVSLPLDHYDHRTKELSGGQMQRVAIARALVNDPAIILADEPTGNLDSATGHQVLETFHRLKDQGKTIVLITHDASVAAEADRIVTIRDGRTSKGVPHEHARLGARGASLTRGESRPQPPHHLGNRNRHRRRHRHDIAHRRCAQRADQRHGPQRRTHRVHLLRRTARRGRPGRPCPSRPRLRGDRGNLRLLHPGASRRQIDKREHHRLEPALPRDDGHAEQDMRRSRLHRRGSRQRCPRDTHQPCGRRGLLRLGRGRRSGRIHQTEQHFLHRHRRRRRRHHRLRLLPRIYARQGGLKDFSNGWNYYSQVVGLAREGADIEALEQETKTQLSKVKRIADEDVEDCVYVYSLKSSIDQFNTFMMSFQVMIGSVAGISLLVGGIGIMNMMLTNVTERIREIGVRRALGASRRDITLQFLAESSTLCIAGGIIGTILGYLVAWGLAFAITALGIDLTAVTGGAGGTTFTPAIEPAAIAIAVGISIFIGVVFGHYPARRAAKLDPVECLRYQ